MISDLDPSFQAPLERNRDLHAQCFCHCRAFDKQGLEEGPHLANLAQLAEGCARKGRDRIESCVADQLEPNLTA